jgi:hypothetical protein
MLSVPCVKWPQVIHIPHHFEYLLQNIYWFLYHGCCMGDKNKLTSFCDLIFTKVICMGKEAINGKT